MPCRDFAKGTCPYRAAYGCDDDVKAIGRHLGHCVIERYFRDCSRDELLKGLDLIEEHERARVERLVELWLDAHVYSLRAATWLGVSFNRPPGEGGYAMDDEQFLRGQRYWLAGGERTLRWLRELRPYLDLVRARRRAAMLPRPASSDSGSPNARTVDIQGTPRVQIPSEDLRHPPLPGAY